MKSPSKWCTVLNMANCAKILIAALLMTATLEARAAEQVTMVMLFGFDDSGHAVAAKVLAIVPTMEICEKAVQQIQLPQKRPGELNVVAGCLIATLQAPTGA